MEDENTAYQTIGPVSKMFNLIVRAHVEGPNSFAYKEHARKRQDFMWLGSEGMLMCGTNGSQLWDIAFITQAVVDTGLGNEEENKQSLIKALEWLDQAQIRTNPKHYKEAYRHATKGAWPFRFVRVNFLCTCYFLQFMNTARENKDIPSAIARERASRQCWVSNSSLSWWSCCRFVLTVDHRIDIPPN
jgi:lanosterol synthase